MSRPPRRPTEPGGPAAPGPGGPSPGGRELDQLRQRVRDLESDKIQLQAHLEGLQNARLRVTPDTLVRSLRTALEAMQRELAGPPDATVEYTVSGFDVDLKAGVETDEAAGVRFRLPDTPGPAGETLSTLRFSIKAIPKPRQPSQ